MEQFLSERVAREVRRHVLKMTSFARASHVASCLSVADLLAVLYCGILRVSPANPKLPHRDRLIMSKGHAAAALYAVLAETAFIPLEWLETFYCNGGELLGHVTHGVPGVEFSTGSLGHGLPVATGLALAGKRDKLPYRVFCILSDGECNEGATWESALFCSHHKLDNLIVIIDYNKMQAMGTTHDVLELEPISDKWNAFGWGTREVDGHEHRALKEALEELPFSPEKPSCLIAHTTKGKGVSFMENQVAWHYKAPNAEELHRALRQLEPC